MDLVLPLWWLRSRPDQDTGIDHCGSRGVLRDDQDAGARLPHFQARTKVDRHRSPVVGDQNALVTGCLRQYLRIRKTLQAEIGGGEKIDAWLPLTSGGDVYSRPSPFNGPGAWTPGKDGK